jgi:hypothetical protein
MKRIAHCQACSNERHGVKSRIAVPHTCGEERLTLKPGPVRTKADQLLIERVESVINKIHALVPGEEINVSGRDFIRYFEYNYNPSKGETAKGELRKWADMLYKDKRISCSSFSGSDIEERLEFKNELTTQLDAFMWHLQKFHEAYGFATKPFGYIASHKDAWALRLQIMERYPVQTKHVILEGITVYECLNMEDGQARFVRI